MAYDRPIPDETLQTATGNPRLRAKLPEAAPTAYRGAPRTAGVETGLPENTFPIDCLWPFERALADED